MYGKVIESMFWAVKANKQMILNSAVPDEVLAAIRDPKCKAWHLKLNGKTQVDLGTLEHSLPIAPQTALQIVSMKPQEIIELVEEEIMGKSKEQLNTIKKCISSICKEQALAHRHAAEAAEHLATLTDLVSLPITIKVMNVTMRPTVAVQIPEVDEMMDRVQEKVEAIKRAKEKTGEV